MKRMPVFTGILASLILSAQTPAASAGPPDGIEEFAVEWPIEVSGVAAVDGGFHVVGDDSEKYLFTVPDLRAHKVWSKDKNRVCDPESIDVGYGPDGQKIELLLSEDFHKVYVRGAGTITLPETFQEQCNRGAEGLSVRWSDGGWDLAVLWEGGVPEEEHVPKKSKKCKAAKKVECPLSDPAYNALVALFRLSADGAEHSLRKTLELPTSDLLKEINPDEAFRATDIAWYNGGFLVLLGSTPLRGTSGSKYAHTWLQGFDASGKPIAHRQLRLERAWKDYWSKKNWEALDTTLDGRRLVMGYDAKGSSEIVVFDPGFDLTQ